MRLPRRRMHHSKVLFRSHGDKTFGRNDNGSIALLEPTYHCIDLLPHGLAFGLAHSLKKWAHLRQRVSSVLHGRGNRGEALGAWHDFHRHVAEAGTLESASKHCGIAQREHSRVFPAATLGDAERLPVTR